MTLLQVDLKSILRLTPQRDFYNCVVLTNELKNTQISSNSLTTRKNHYTEEEAIDF